MKLRDTIALEAMKIIMSGFESETVEFSIDVDEEAQREFEDSIARGAYMMADAMMRVRDEVNDEY